jgi:hypothetical protein
MRINHQVNHSCLARVGHVGFTFNSRTLAADRLFVGLARECPSTLPFIKCKSTSEQGSSSSPSLMMPIIYAGFDLQSCVVVRGGPPSSECLLNMNVEPVPHPWSVDSAPSVATPHQRRGLTTEGLFYRPRDYLCYLCDSPCRSDGVQYGHPFRGDH